MKLATLAAASILIVLAACAATAPDTAKNPPNAQLLNAATALERNARVLAQRAGTIGSGFAQDADELLSHASEFRAALASGRGSADDLQAYFDQLTSSYDSLRSDAKTLDTTMAHSAVALVSGPYQDVAAHMNASHPGL